MLAYTLILSILTVHINLFFFGIQWQNTPRKSFIITKIRPMFLCLFFVFSALIMPWSRLEHECCWSFLVTLIVCGVTFVPGEDQAQVSSLCQQCYFQKPRLILRYHLWHPENSTYIICRPVGHFFFILPILQKRERSICLWGPLCWFCFESFKRCYVVAHNWLYYIRKRWVETHEILKIYLFWNSSCIELIIGATNASFHS